jgi:hypothetical protein
MRLISTTRWLLALGAVLIAAACSDESTGPNLSRDYVQEDRFGLPAIATVFIPTTGKDAYNQAPPAGDSASYFVTIRDKLVAFGNSMPAAEALAGALVPDIQPYNSSMGTAFLNGRKPADDVITAELGLIFGSNTDLNDDHVDANDRTFGSTFPYLAAPQ